jgi:hypothetical protein
VNTSSSAGANRRRPASPIRISPHSRPSAARAPSTSSRIIRPLRSSAAATAARSAPSAAGASPPSPARAAARSASPSRIRSHSRSSAANSSRSSACRACRSRSRPSCRSRSSLRFAGVSFHAPAPSRIWPSVASCPRRRRRPPPPPPAASHRPARASCEGKLRGGEGKGSGKRGLVR